MLPDGIEIRKVLESEFDIPFTVSKTINGREPVFWITPTNPGKELFTLKISFQNRVRLRMEFIPEKYSVSFIQAMGHRSEEAKMRFVAYAKALSAKGAKYSVRANSKDLNIDAPNEWPTEWNSFEARVTKMPVNIDAESSYAAIAADWSSLMMGLVLSLADIVPIDPEEDVIQGREEGTLQRVTTNRYERNPLNRQLCLAIHGYACKICGMDFEKVYGEIGHRFIHVHHIVPVSQLGAGYVIDPMNDLIPVCPNCHAMLHRKNPPYSPDEIREVLRVQNYSIYYKNVPSQIQKVAEPETEYGKKEGVVSNNNRR